MSNRIKLIVLIVVLNIFGCLEANNGTRKGYGNNPHIIEIKGYTYYQWKGEGTDGYAAPTPETIKKCINEVLDEREKR